MEYSKEQLFTFLGIYHPLHLPRQCERVVLPRVWVKRASRTHELKPRASPALW